MSMCDVLGLSRPHPTSLVYILPMTTPLLLLALVPLPVSALAALPLEPLLPLDHDPFNPLPSAHQALPSSSSGGGIGGAAQYVRRMNIILQSDPRLRRETGIGHIG
jgi:hypothetical protein